MAALKLLGGASAHFAATLGLSDVVEVPKSLSLCEMVSTGDHAVVVDDAWKDPRLAAHPLVTGSAQIRFLGAAPLHHGGHIVGALCVFDNEPRRMDATTTRRLLERIARRVDAETSLRHRLTSQPFPVAADQDDIVSAISHEIRTPLTAIRGNLELLAETPGAIAADHARRVDAITRNADRLCRTVDSLLRAVSLQLREPTGRRLLIDLGEIVADVVAGVGDAIGHIRLEQPGRPVWVLADERLLQIAIGNLLSNALSFGASGRPVEITVAEAPRPSLEIRDHGPGLDEAELSLLGTPFFRGGDARRSESPGLGLGLTISRRIIEAQDGTLRLLSGLGAGFTARVEFSAARHG